MGQSLSAHLFYGFEIYARDEVRDDINQSWVEKHHSDFDEDDDMFDRAIVAWEEQFAANYLGLEQVKYRHEQSEKEETLWLEYRKKLTDAIELLGLEISYYGHDDCAIWYIACDSISSYETKVISELPLVSKTCYNALRQLCEMLQIPWQEPKWHLAARYL